MVESALVRLAQVGVDATDDENARQRKTLLVLVAVLILPISLVWGVLYLAIGTPGGYLALLYFVVSLGAIAIFARTRDFDMLLRVELLDIMLAPTISMIPLGGFLASGAIGLWGILGPLGALVFSGVRAGIRWYLAYLAVFFASGVVGEVTGSLAPIPAWFTSTMLALNIAVGGTIVFTLLALFAKQREEALAAMRIAQDSAEHLLRNVLPRTIADKLRAAPQTIADQFPSASILFADVVDFTPRSEGMAAADVVGMLDHLFSHFDALAERHGVEKIKTIGDCYMVAAGVPSPRPDHARALALMALDMVEAMRSRDGVGHLGLELRIGINSGPVVAGVIGRSRFLYDLWGDAVNTASRMESHGVPGRIQITRDTFELINHEFVCERRGTVTIKGKGAMETWYLMARRESAGAPRLRPATPDDADAIASIWSAGWGDGHLGNVPEELVAVRHEASFRARAPERIDDTTVAEVDGEVVAFVMVVDDEIEQVYVAAAHRGSGIADALMEDAERQIRQAGHASAWLAVVDGNARARRFYERRGWSDAGPIVYDAAGEESPIPVPARRYVKQV